MYLFYTFHFSLYLNKVNKKLQYVKCTHFFLKAHCYVDDITWHPYTN